MIALLSALMPLLLRVVSTLACVFGLQQIVAQVTGQPGVAMQQLTNSFKDGTQNAISAATGGLVPKAETVTDEETKKALPQPDPGLAALGMLTNPLLYVAIGGLLLFATTLTKQTRGLARDVGGGISTARGAVKDDFDELQSDPSGGSRRK